MKSLLFVCSICMIIHGNVLSIYDSVRYDETDSVMSSAYTGPIFASGGADSGHIIKEMQPEKIGYAKDKQIILIGDTANEIYSFDSITYYEVSKNGESFYIIKILATYNLSTYDIIIELRHGSNFDRVMTIYKNGKPDLLVLWVETMRMKQKLVRKI